MNEEGKNELTYNEVRYRSEEHTSTMVVVFPEAGLPVIAKMLLGLLISLTRSFMVYLLPSHKNFGCT